VDSRAQQARDHHRASSEGERLAKQHRDQRDELVRALYATGEWSYPQMAAAVGCSPELIAKIINPQRSRKAQSP
jgi:hypothetical protein